jgi:hypothetical protein
VGETKNRPFQLSINISLKVDFQGLRVASDAGLLVAEGPLTRGQFAAMLRRITLLPFPAG